MADRITISVTNLRKGDFSNPLNRRGIQRFFQMVHQALQYSGHPDHSEDLLSVQIASCQSLKHS